MPDLTPITRFMNKVKQLSNSNNKDVRISISEALELTACITELLATKITDTKPATLSTVALDGGSLKGK